jgi:hypothetical protein
MDVMQPIHEAHHIVSYSLLLVEGAPNNRSQGRYNPLPKTILASVVPVVLWVDAL